MGKISLLDLHTRDDLLGEVSVAGGRRYDSAVAKSTSVVWVIHYNLLLEMVRLYDLLPFWTEFLADRLREQQEIISQFVTLDSERRLAARLLMLGKRIGHVEGTRIRIVHRITHEELAAMVGTTRSRIGFFLNNFERAGLIERSTLGVLVTPTMLREYLGELT